VADYNEMAIQIGFMTMFAVALPIGPLLALLNNLLELRIDAGKLTRHTRRPHFRAAEDIGSWQAVIAVLTTLGAGTVGRPYIVLSAFYGIWGMPCNHGITFPCEIAWGCGVCVRLDLPVAAAAPAVTPTAAVLTNALLVAFVGTSLASVVLTPSNLASVVSRVVYAYALGRRA
jgi:hypothetical protein